MPSPFPGMNPYFEQPGLWRGFHTSLIVKMMDALGPAAAPRYFVNVKESLYIEQPHTERGELFAVADNAISRNEDAPVPTRTTTLAAPTTAPVTARVRLGAITRKHRWLTVRDSQDRRVVTAIELLSPSNKANDENREQHEQKCRRLLASPANLVEIDLLRGGLRMPWVGFPECDYCVTVSRRGDRPRVGFWPFRVRNPMPVIPIPLRPGEAEPRLDLQALLQNVYDAAGYEDYLYEALPEPRLPPPDDAWAADIARAATPTT